MELDWFTKTDIKKQTVKNNRENEKRCRALLMETFKDPNYVLKNFDDYNRLINSARNQYSPSTVCRMINWFKFNCTAENTNINLQLPLKNLRKEQNHDNFLSASDFTLLFDSAYNKLVERKFTDPNHQIYICVFILCALFGLRVSDAKTLTHQQIAYLLTNGSLIIKQHKTNKKQVLVIQEKDRKILEILYENMIDIKLDSSHRLHELFNTHYKTVLNKQKPKQLGFHALRYRFSTINISDTNNINNKRLEMGHSSTDMTNYYQQIQLSNEYNLQNDNLTNGSVSGGGCTNGGINTAASGSSVISASTTTPTSVEQFLASNGGSACEKKEKKNCNLKEVIGGGRAGVRNINNNNSNSITTGDCGGGGGGISGNIDNNGSGDLLECRNGSSSTDDDHLNYYDDDGDIDYFANEGKDNRHTLATLFQS